jgi:NAD(P)-dependent dehydrogenase (short-subunit alcohol dehydrogenase family)
MMSSKKIALVTGANKGIGYETVRQLAAKGITVLLGARDEKRGLEATQTLKKEGLDVQFLQVDVNDSASRENAAKFIADKFGKLDILVNNAGVALDFNAPASKGTAEQWRETFETNLFSLISLTQKLLPLRRGLDAFRKDVVSIAPFLLGTVNEIDDWQKVRLLTVQINRLRRWYRPGLLFIGDAAHAMSPVGGVGINLAIQDAVASANLLADRLRKGTCEVDDLRRIQKRREWPTRLIQEMQVFVHRQTYKANPDTERAPYLPWPARLLLWLLVPLIRRVISRIIGIGFRAEHIRT